MNSKFFGLGAKLAVCFVAVLGTLTSCYEKEDIKTVIDTTPKTVTYTISGSVYDYANLQGVGFADVVVKKAGTEVKNVKTEANGQFAVTLSGLKEADRGEYSLIVNASGYKERSTSFSIYFEEAANQTIATHLDFALKALDVQGEEVKIVAGREDEEVEIVGVNGEIDDVFIPKNVFGGAEPKTITIVRESKSIETANTAVRVYEGKPDGLQFTDPLVFSFDAPADKQFKVYYEEGGIWKIAEGSDSNVTFDAATGKYVAKTWHFSRFKFSENDYDYTVKSDTVSSKGTTYTASLAYYNETNENASYPFQVKGLVSGAKYVTPLEEVFAQCPVKEIAINYFEEYLENTYSELPGADFKHITLNTQVIVPAHHNLLSATTTEDFETITYTMTFDGKNYVVKVVKVKEYKIVPTTADYTHGQGIGHGHGHGDGLNAGGGIIDFE